RHGPLVPALRIEDHQASQPRLEKPETTLMDPWRMGHGELPQNNFPARNVDQATPDSLVGPPAARRIGFSQAGDTAGPATLHGQAIEVATVLRRQSAHEPRIPPGDEAMASADGAEA